MYVNAVILLVLLTMLFVVTNLLFCHIMHHRCMQSIPGNLEWMSQHHANKTKTGLAGAVVH